MRLFNTLSQRVEPFTPLGEEVTMYVCGVTPYDTTHLGHAFINVIYDSQIRYFRWQGQPVRYVQNVTDIDDDVLRKSREVGIAWDELGRREVARYKDDLNALNVAPPTLYIAASTETAKMIELIQALLAQGHAYEQDGWVYFSVKSDPGFGKLAEAAGYVGYDSWLATANERGNFPDDPRKRDPLDFVLWQGQQPGEPAWESPWGPGRPGWHIECSSMIVKYLGSRIDIHGGGSDLIFPHHTCEIAQSENATGEHPFVQVWMHCAMVGLGGEKMSKSLGNLILVSNLRKAYTNDAIRLLLLSHHYRLPWEYTEADMQAAAQRAETLTHAAMASVQSSAQTAQDADADEAITSAREAFCQALDDDFQTPTALDALETLGEQTLAAPTQARVAALRELAGVLGFRLEA